MLLLSTYSQKWTPVRDPRTSWAARPQGTDLRAGLPVSQQVLWNFTPCFSFIYSFPNSLRHTLFISNFWEGASDWPLGMRQPVDWFLLAQSTVARLGSGIPTVFPELLSGDTSVAPVTFEMGSSSFTQSVSSFWTGLLPTQCFITHSLPPGLAGDCANPE